MELKQRRRGYNAVILEPAATWMKESKCLGCGKPKNKWNRRTDWSCCSNECTEKKDRMYYIVNWADVREKVLTRDKHTCQKCRRKETHDTENYSKSVFLEADHITPISLGGDEWDMDNVQTLCVPCHKVKTKKDAAKITQYRKQHPQQEVLDFA